MAEKLWRDCSKEERQKVNTIWRCHKAFNYLHNNGMISDYKYKQLVKKEKEALNYLEWYYSDEVQDKIAFMNWKEGYEQYQKVRVEYENKSYDNNTSL